MVIYEPSPEKILEALLPEVINMVFYKLSLEAVTSEQIARRVAMKSATDAASEMIKLLTRGYNRVRQAKITQEISEIVAGADSLK
jgi:F-type H+-transporting ATPase subunit gamma